MLEFHSKFHNSLRWFPVLHGKEMISFTLIIKKNKQQKTTKNKQTKKQSQWIVWKDIFQNSYQM